MVDLLRTKGSSVPAGGVRIYGSASHAGAFFRGWFAPFRCDDAWSGGDDVVQVSGASGIASGALSKLERHNDMSITACSMPQQRLLVRPPPGASASPPPFPPRPPSERASRANGGSPGLV